MTRQELNPPAPNRHLLSCRSLVVDRNFFVYLKPNHGRQESAFNTARKAAAGPLWAIKKKRYRPLLTNDLIKIQYERTSVFKICNSDT